MSGRMRAKRGLMSPPAASSSYASSARTSRRVTSSSNSSSDGRSMCAIAWIMSAASSGASSRSHSRRSPWGKARSRLPCSAGSRLRKKSSASSWGSVLKRATRSTSGSAGHSSHKSMAAVGVSSVIWGSQSVARRLAPTHERSNGRWSAVSLLRMRTDGLTDGLDRGDTAALARAISLVENQRDGFERVLAHVHERVGRVGTRRIGITGPPGAGKSTLTDHLTRAFRARDLKVAVVAVDPTSRFSGGALLGDRVRMESVSLDPGVFIRSMATRGSQGGLAMTTEEVCDVLDAFGFDRILIETVGVGQTELDVASTAETTVLVLVPESGDGIQALKAGVMEVADVYV